MLRLYYADGVNLRTVTLETASMETLRQQTEPPVWIDLLHPLPQEESLVEEYLGIDVPTREDMQAIEVSSRLYTQNNAEFMTVMVVTGMQDPRPVNTPVTFILTDKTLVTLRYSEPKSFLNYLQMMSDPQVNLGTTAEHVLFGLLEAVIHRLADGLEKIADEIDGLATQVFAFTNGQQAAKHDFRETIHCIGRKEATHSLMKESLLTLSRLLAYHVCAPEEDCQGPRDIQNWVKTLQDDIIALNDHAKFLSDKIAFLLDATLGLINLEQNQIIKFFSVAAVAFMPPTLIASIYGMNFQHMPELEWLLAYPIVLIAMVIAMVLPLWYFHRKGWL